MRIKNPDGGDLQSFVTILRLPPFKIEFLLSNTHLINMNLSIGLLSKTIENLEAHPEALRIKKFIYCLCNSCWENDLNVFNQQSTEELLLELMKIQPTIKGLSLSMYGLVKSLNNQKLYASLAKVIVEQL